MFLQQFFYQFLVITLLIWVLGTLIAFFPYIERGIQSGAALILCLLGICLPLGLLIWVEYLMTKDLVGVGVLLFSCIVIVVAQGCKAFDTFVREKYDYKFKLSPFYFKELIPRTVILVCLLSAACLFLFIHTLLVRNL